jgi:hypothetical protein
MKPSRDEYIRSSLAFRAGRASRQHEVELHSMHSAVLPKQPFMGALRERGYGPNKKKDIGC